MGKVFKNCLLVVIVLMFLGFIGVVILKSYYDNAISTKSTKTTATSFTINSGEGVQQISADLYQDNLISNTLVFILYLKENGVDTKIQSGTYTIPPQSSIKQIATILQSASSNEVLVTVKSGERLEEEAASIDQQMSIDNSVKQFSASDFISLAHTPSKFTFPFITTSTTTIEGFLFPDTYFFNKNATAQTVINTILENFDKKVYAQYGANSANGLSFYQHIILASIIEREAQSDKDKKLISDILLRRLETNYPLGTDVTIEYELGYSQAEQTWWRQTIYEDQLQTPNPYNTRLNTGLPPTPICSMTLGTIIDAYSPTPNQYFYFLADKSGVIHYAVTNDEQNANIAKYLN
jgi:UPF0755 protein